MNKLLLLGLLIFSSVALAGVNIKNGNFYVVYKDLEVPGGGKDLVISRTYNSYKGRVGWFGLGWASEFETRLVSSADGSVTIHEHGSGAQRRFTPKSSVDPAAAADKILGEFRKGKTLSEKAAKTFRDNLINDSDLRLAWSNKLNISVQLANGTKLYSSERGLQHVEVTKSGYVRAKQDGSEHHFNKSGQLIKMKDKYGYQVDIKYKGGSVEKIVDSQAKAIYFEWYSGTPKKVKHVWSANDKKALYKYEDDQMVEATDVAGNNYKYSYDNRFKNLSEVSYSNKETMEIGYDLKKGWATRVKTRDGDETKYVYGADKKNPDMHYWTEVKKKGFDGKWRTNKYEYEIKKRKDGSSYTYRTYTSLSGRETETIYSECCGLPLKINQGKHTTTFTYKDGLMTSKVSTKGESVKLKYDDKLKKITYVKNNEGETYFKYSKKGDLKQAKNKTSQVNLFYDRKGRIKKMINAYRVTKKKQVLEFKYNNQGKPVEIKMGGIGSIKVSYDNYGEIKNVNSKEGHKMALKVTQAFQSLLAIVKPAGVNLNL
jgi:hypothetical protein